MNKKYYTPKESEFHIGFVYEGLNEDGEWEETTFQNGRSVDYYEENRVKCLDQEDILSLGWGPKNHSNYEFQIEANGSIYFLNFNPRNNLVAITQDAGMFTEWITYVYTGIIRNKRELEIIMENTDIVSLPKQAMQ